MNHVWSTIDYSAMSTFILNLSSNLLITIELFWATTDEENKSMGIPSGGRNQGLLVYDRNHYFGFGPIPKPIPKLVDTFGRYRNRYRNHISKGKSSYQ